MLTVPTLRRLRELPEATESAASAVPHRDWNAHRQMTTGLFSTLAALLLWAGWLSWTMPEVPKFNAARWEQSVRAQWRQVTPTQVWGSWQYGYKGLPQAGFQKIDAPEQAQIEERIEERSMLLYGVLAAAGVCGLLGVLALCFGGRRQ